MKKKEPIEILLKPINEFLHEEASGGILTGSLLSGIVGFVFIKTSEPKI